MNQNEEQLNTTRHRTINYTNKEIETLIVLVKRYKKVVLNKSTTTTARILKDTAWKKIETLFNKENQATDVDWKNAESLRNKWKNLLNVCKQSPSNIAHDSVLQEVDKLRNDFYATVDIRILPTLEEMDDGVPVKSVDGVWLQCEDKLAEADNEDGDLTSDDGERRVRCSNFSSEENKLLIECVRPEKEYIFSKDGSKSGVKLKSDAWDRIAIQFNKRTNSSRSAKVLKTKFDNMKRVLKRGGSMKKFWKDNLGNKHQRLQNETHIVKVKIEPDISKEESDFADDNGFDSLTEDDPRPDPAPDPLGAVLSGGFGGPAGLGRESKEVVRMQLQLLQCQMETAKLERQRVLDAIKSDSAERESRAVEASLRLRAARLRAAAAARALPAGDPALRYRPDEEAAQKYLAEDQDYPRFDL